MTYLSYFVRETVGDSRKLKVGFRETFSFYKGYTGLALIFNLIGRFVSLARRLGFTSLAYCQLSAEFMSSSIWRTRDKSAK